MGLLFACNEFCKMDCLSVWIQCILCSDVCLRWKGYVNYFKLHVSFYSDYTMWQWKRFVLMELFRWHLSWGHLLFLLSYKWISLKTLIWCWIQILGSNIIVRNCAKNTTMIMRILTISSNVTRMQQKFKTAHKTHGKLLYGKILCL